MREHHCYVYIVASRSRTLYIGITNRLLTRVQEHREGTVDGFTKQYQCHRLVYYESFEYVNLAITREKQLKGWIRSKKMALIDKENPTWEDLSQSWKAETPRYDWHAKDQTSTRGDNQAGPSTPLRSAQDDKG